MIASLIREFLTWERLILIIRVNWLSQVTIYNRVLCGGDTFLETPSRKLLVRQVGD